MKSSVIQILSLCLLAILCRSNGVHASETTTSGQRVYGWVEKGIVMPLGALVKIKLDTGALTSSMHAADIELYDIPQGGDGVRFTLELEDKETGELIKRQMDLDVERYLVVRGAGGSERRPVVKLKLCIGNHVFDEEFSLRDRGEMLYPVLIGRKMLERLGMVDSNSTFLTTPECEVSEAVLNRQAPGMG